MEQLYQDNLPAESEQLKEAAENIRDSDALVGLNIVEKKESAFAKLRYCTDELIPAEGKDYKKIS